MKLLVGLGNPENKYAGTRHNLGFDILDELVKKFNLVEWSKEERFKAELIKTPELLLARPQTYMNNSGLAVGLLSAYYKIAPEDIIVVHDELDLLLGRVKVRLGGAASGHHGVESIIAALETDEFVRVRIGIGNEQSHSGERKRISFNAEKFVLELFTPQEKHKVKHAIKQSLKAIEILLEEGLEEAQNQFNG